MGFFHENYWKQLMGHTVYFGNSSQQKIVWAKLMTLENTFTTNSSNSFKTFFKRKKDYRVNVICRYMKKNVQSNMSIFPLLKKCFEFRSWVEAAVYVSFWKLNVLTNKMKNDFVTFWPTICFATEHYFCFVWREVFLLSAELAAQCFSSVINFAQTISCWEEFS